jgi:hypothetical protein
MFFIFFFFSSTPQSQQTYSFGICQQFSVPFLCGFCETRYEAVTVTIDDTVDYVTIHSELSRNTFAQVAAIHGTIYGIRFGESQSLYNF